MDEHGNMLLTSTVLNRPKAPVINATSWRDLSKFAHREPGYAGCCSHLANSSGVTEVAFFLANSSVERNNRNKAKHCIKDCRRPPRRNQLGTMWAAELCRIQAGTHSDVVMAQGNSNVPLPIFHQPRPSFPEMVPTPAPLLCA